MFDWEAFLNTHAIEFKVASATERAVRCPFCGAADPSQHMSINLEGKGWHCWRQPAEHSGKDPTRLVQALLGISREGALRITRGPRSTPTNLTDRVRALLHPAPRELPPLTLPPEFKPISDDYASRPFVDYLRRRGFTPREIATLSRDYDLRYCRSGQFRGRIIFPVYYHNRLMTWTARTIYRSVDLRYATLGKNDGAPPITHFLLWYDKLARIRARRLYICEGPFDALRVMTFGAAATCLFTAQPSEQQIQLLHELTTRFRECCLLLDQNTLAATLRTISRLRVLSVRRETLPEGVKDPGELSRREFNLVEFARDRV